MGEVILAVDTTQGACSVALWDAHATKPHTILREMQIGHAEALMPMLIKLLATTNTALHTITRFAVTTGPGGFVGVRLGLCTMRTLAFARNRPIIGIPTLTAMAAAYIPPKPMPILVAIDARRYDYFVQLFECPSADSPLAHAPQVHKLESLLSILPTAALALVGTGAAAIYAARNKHDFCTDAPPYPQAEIVARLAATMPLPKPYAPPNPIYLRPPRARLPA